MGAERGAVSVEPGSTRAGTSVRPTVKRTVQRPFAAGRSGTVSDVSPLTGILARPTTAPPSVATTVCGRVKSRASPWSVTASAAAGALDPLVGRPLAPDQVSFG